MLGSRGVAGSDPSVVQCQQRADDAGLDTLFLALPISWRGTLACVEDVGLAGLEVSRCRAVDADFTAPTYGSAVRRFHRSDHHG